MKQSTIKAKDTEILVGSKGKTLDRVLSSSESKEGKIINLGTLEVDSTAAVAGVITVNLIDEQKEKLLAATANDVCRVLIKWMFGSTILMATPLIGSIDDTNSNIATFYFFDLANSGRQVTRINLTT